MLSTDKINGKIQRAEQMKVHTMLVIGNRDMEANAVSVRVHGKGNLGAKPRDEVIADILHRSKSDGASKPNPPIAGACNAKLSAYAVFRFRPATCGTVREQNAGATRKIDFQFLCAPSNVRASWTRRVRF